VSHVRCAHLVNLVFTVTNNSKFCNVMPVFYWLV